MLKAYNYLSQIKSLIKNSFILMLVRILGPVCSFVIIVLVSRKLGASIAGTYIIACNFFLIFYYISLLGLDNFVTREISRNKHQADKYIINLGFIGLISSFLCFILICVLVALLDYSWEIKKATYLIGLALFPAVGTHLCESVFIAFEKTKYLLFAVIIEQAFVLLLGLAALLLGYGINALMFSIVIGKLLGLAAGLYFITRFINKLHLDIDFEFCRRIIVETTPVFALIVIISNILFRIDIVALSKLRETLEVSWYGTAYSFIGISYILGAPFTQSIFPVISRLFINSKELFGTVCKKVLLCIAILLFPLAIITGFLSDKLVLLFFGEKFLPSVDALKILVGSIFPVSWAGFCGYILYAGNQQKMVLYAFGITLGVSFILHIFLSYYWGYLGTSMATLISMHILAILMSIFIHKYIFKFNLAQILWKPFLSAVFAGIFIYLGKQYLNIFVLLLPCLIIYCLFLIGLRVFSKKDMILLQELQKSLFKFTPAPIKT